MTIVADAYRFVIGIDTHAKTHHWAIIESRTGGVIDNREFPTTPAGINRAITWIRRRTHQATTNTVLVSMEGTGSYGTKAARALLEAGYRVTDAPARNAPEAPARTMRSTRSPLPATSCTNTATTSRTCAPATPRNCSRCY